MSEYTDISTESQDSQGGGNQPPSGPTPPHISLDPDDAIDCSGDDDRDIVALVKRTAVAAERDENTSIHSFPNYLRWQIVTLAGKAGHSQEIAAAYCIEKGVEMLWQLPGIVEIKSAPDFIAAHSDDPEDMLWFGNSHFDIPTMNTGHKKFQGRISPDVRRKYGTLAAILGLNQNKVAILAIMATLMDAKFIREKYKRNMFNTLVVFGTWVKERAEKAQKRREQVKTRAVNGHCNPEIVLTFDDVLAELTS